MAGWPEPMNSRNDTAPVLSFVLPVYNEVMNLETMAERLEQVGETLGVPYEIVFVDDGSTDGSGDLLDELEARRPAVRAVHFSRNFGHMAALCAGMETARGTGAVVCLDADGQHPPELIPELVDRWKGGADIVQTIRVSTADETPFKRLTSRLFYALMRRLSELELPEGAADFRLMDRQVVDALNSLPERVRFLRGLVKWVGFRSELFPYTAPSRLGGATKYNFRRMLLFALNGITSFSMRPLRLIFFLGMFVLLLAGAYAAYVLGCVLLDKPLVPGWTSLLLVTLFLGGIQLMTLGVASEYLGRMYDEIKQRPIYLVRKPRKHDE